MFKPFFVLDAEALLLIHDHQPKVTEYHVLRQKPVGADGNVHLAFPQIRQSRLEFFGRTKSAEHLGPYGEGLEPPLEGLEVLKC